MKHIPQRTCIVCREQKDKGSLIRIVRRQDGRVVLDATGREAGRGAYVCSDGDCINTLIKKRMLARAFKTQFPEEVYEKLSEQLLGNNIDG